MANDTNKKPLVGIVMGSKSDWAVMQKASAMLTELGYSRGFEREADDYATVMLQRLHIPSHRLGDILQRMSKGHEDGPGYLSTHPPTRERVERLRDR